MSADQTDSDSRRSDMDLRVLLVAAVAVVAIGGDDDVPPSPVFVGRNLQHHGDWEAREGPRQGLRWEESGYLEGDIMTQGDEGRNGLLDTSKRWPNRVMPYYIDSVFTQEQRAVIESAIADYNSLTCVTMRPYVRGDKQFITIKGDDTGCWSYIGAHTGGQVVNLQRNGCVYKGTAIHELLHAWGFYHQHSATERDDYVVINWNNIQQGMEHNFEKKGAADITSFGVTYDYGSIMHYSAYAFSRNNKMTISAPEPIGQNYNFSTSDITKLERMYKCRGALSAPLIAHVLLALFVCFFYGQVAK